MDWPYPNDYMINPYHEHLINNHNNDYIRFEGSETAVNPKTICGTCTSDTPESTNQVDRDST